MSGPIQLIPQGFLGLLQLKQTGKNPDVMIDQVQPTYDLVAQYLERNAQSESGLFGGTPTTAALASAAHGYQAFSFAGNAVVVPNNELWFIHAASMDLLTNTIAAADTLTAGLLMGGGAENTGTLITPVYADVITARARSWTTPPIQKTWWAKPGSNFFAAVLDILTATSITIQLHMKATRIPI